MTKKVLDLLHGMYFYCVIVPKAVVFAARNPPKKVQPYTKLPQSRELSKENK